MSKKYKDKLCVYCGMAQSTTGDHVVAREFFLPGRRADLPKVPACGACNVEKSKLEHYLTTVLPFGGRHVDAVANLQTMVPKRLEKNAKLHTSLLEGFTGDKLPLETGRIEALFMLIAKGLLHYHWQTILGEGDCTAATVIWDGGSNFLDHIFQMNARDRIKQSLGEGTFVYEGIQAKDYPQFTLWKFLIYGGLCFGDPRNPSEKASLIFAVTGPRTLLPRFWATVFGGEP